MKSIADEMRAAGVKTFGELLEKMRAEATPEEIAAAREKTRAELEEELRYCDRCGDPLETDPDCEPDVCPECLLCPTCCGWSDCPGDPDYRDL
jgi:hypothetical protein